MTDQTKNAPENLVTEKKTWIRPDIQMIEGDTIRSGGTHHYHEASTPGSTYNATNS